MTCARIPLFHRATLSHLGDGGTKVRFRILKITSDGAFSQRKTAILTSCLLCQISTCTETHTLRVTRQDPLIGTYTWSKVDGKMKKAKWKE